MKLNIQKISHRSVTLTRHREFLIIYLNMKTAEQDWHGVADAAMDLRDVDAELKGIKECLDD